MSLRFIFLKYGNILEFIISFLDTFQLCANAVFAHAVADSFKSFSLTIHKKPPYDFVKQMNMPAKDLPLAEKIEECQQKCGKTYGYRRVHEWLKRENIHCNPKTVLRVMQKYNLPSVVRRKKYHITVKFCTNILFNLKQN